MFDIGWTEMLVIAVVMIVVVGPKDLPKMLRTFGRTTAKLRAMAGDFQKQFNEALKEAELDDVKKSVDSLRDLNPASQIKKQLNPFEKAAADVRSGLDTLKPKPPEPASPVATAAEPLKGGAAAVPGDGADQASTKPDGSAAPQGPVEPAPVAEPAVAAPAAAKPAATPVTVTPEAAPREGQPESSAT
jgi:sec-independent protein translocase protein TatB